MSGIGIGIGIGLGVTKGAVIDPVVLAYIQRVTDDGGVVFLSASQIENRLNLILCS